MKKFKEERSMIEESILITGLCLIVVAAIIAICRTDDLFKPADYTKVYITKGLCPKCTHFDKYSKRCFAPEKSMYSKRLGYTIYYSHTPIDGLSSCCDYYPEECFINIKIETV